MSVKVAALFVERDGVYFDVPGVDPWDESRDARIYSGPYPVVAHPPCQRWGRYWSGGPGAAVPRRLGDDNGCFRAALNAVRLFGGVLEHPEASHAWKAFDLNRPPKFGGWVNADFQGGWTCCVEQGHYGHKARKATWLYAYGIEISCVPRIRWGKAKNKVRFESLGKKLKLATPEPFRDLLLEIARLAYGP